MRFINLFLFFFVCILPHAFSQTDTLILDAYRDQNVVIYRISKQDALELYTVANSKKEAAKLHTLVRKSIDTVLVSQFADYEFPYGYYISERIVNTSLQYELHTSAPFDMKIINNERDFVVLVHDIHGAPILDADVKINHRKIRLDKKTNTYRIPTANCKGTLQVTVNSITKLYDVQRRQNSSDFKRFTHSFLGVVLKPIRIGLYHTPLKYVARPVRRVITFPYRAIKYPYAVTSIPAKAVRAYHKTKAFAISSYYYFNIDKADKKSLENDYEYYNNYYNRNNFTTHKSAVYLNQPKYKLKDSLFCKAFITNKKGKPYNKDIKVFIVAQENYRNKVISKQVVSPTHKGSYDFRIKLQDLGQLKLDKDYTIVFKPIRGKEKIATQTFRLEEYKLKNVTWDVSMPKTEFYAPDSIKITITGKDANKQPIMGGKVMYSMNVTRIMNHLSPIEYVPFVIVSDTVQISPEGKAEISIPSSVLPHINARCGISLTMCDANNELHSEHRVFTYYKTRAYITHVHTNNTFRVAYLENTDTVVKQAFISYIDANNAVFLRDTIELPANIAPHAFASRIQVNVDDLAYTITSSSAPAGVRFSGAFLDKNLVLQIDNSRNLPVYYELFVNKRKIHRDTCTQLQYSKRANIRKNYLVSMQYVWAGKVVSDFYSVRKKKNQLEIVQINKKNVSPGDSVDVTFIVKNYKNKPVKNVDITSWAISSKFTEYTTPQTITFAENVVGPQQINSFAVRNQKNASQNKAMLQSDVNTHHLRGVSYYDFRFPYQTIQKYEIPTPDSSTQFAPYVFVDGIIQPIYFLYVNSVPVYYNFCGSNTNYSFDVPQTMSKSVTIEMRIPNKTIRIQDVKFTPGMKTMLSVDAINCKACEIKDMPQYLTHSEKSLLQRTVCRISPRYNAFTLVETSNLFYKSTTNQSFFIGPVRQSTITVQDFTNKVNVTIPFMPRDDVQAHSNYAYIIKSDYWFPYFEYDKEDTKKKNIVLKPDVYLQPITPYDFKLTRQDALKDWRKRYDDTFYNSYQTNTNYKKMDSPNYYVQVLTDEYKSNPHNKRIFRIVLFNLQDSSIVIDKATVTRLYPYKPGEYVLMLVFLDKSYWVSPQFTVQDAGITYVTIPKTIEIFKEFHLLSNSQLYTAYLIAEKQTEIDVSKAQGITKKYYQSEKLLPYEKQKVTHESAKAIAVSGKITDDKGEPLVAASIVEVGTTNGIYSDIDGNFVLWVHDTIAEIEISYVGMVTKLMQVGSRRSFEVTMYTDAIQLQSVVRVGYAQAKREDVTGAISQVSSKELVFSVDQALQGKAAGVQIRSNSGTPGSDMDIVVRGRGTTGDARPLYVVDGVPVGSEWNGDPNTVESISILKDASSTAIYGSRGANGVVLITTKGGNSVSASSFSWKDAAKRPDVYASNQIRETFRDYAYWQPTLRTDKHGMVKFTAKMPDDINTWNTFVVAHSAKRQSGDYQSQIITDKPLIAELSVPDFLLEGDTSIIRGNAKNYGGSAVSVTNTFIHNGKQLSISDTVVQTIITNEQAIVAPHIDTCKVQFTTATNFGYSDTEIRKIPVFPQGTKETVGMFAYALRDTVLWIKPDTVVGNVNLHVAASTIDIYKKELMRLQQYPHACNEQKASRLMGYLLWEKICKNSNQPFTGRAQVISLIKQLDDNNYEHSGWAWWGKAEPVLWVTLHVIKSLQMAKDMGYTVQSTLETPLISYNSDMKSKSLWQKLEMLETLYSVSQYVDEEYLASFDTLRYVDDYSKLRIIRLKQLYGMPYSIDSVIAKAQVSYTGGAYWGNERYRYSTGNIIPQTLCAYNILQADTTHSFDLQSVFFYFAMERNKTGYWMNTLESAQILSTLVPLAIMHAQPVKPAKLVIPHISAETITAFPYSTEFPAVDSFKLELSCNRPVYITSSTSYWNPKPNVKSEYFDVSSVFKRDKVPVQTLSQGEKVDLHVTIRAKKDAEYVMIEIPIPAGCTYESKQKHHSEVHREHFNNKVYVYVQRMPKGTHTYTVKLSSTHAGTYTLNPARVELMYYPIFNGHNACEKVVVK